MRPAATVAIPTIPPRSQLLERALVSAHAQTVPVAVVVAVDEDREGEWTTRNRALALVETEWTAFLDDDDELLPGHVEMLLARQRETGADVVYPWFAVVWDDGHEDPKWGAPVGFDMPFDAGRLRSANYIPVTTLVRTSLALEVGGFPEPGPPHAQMVDWGFLLRMVDAGASFAHLPAVTWAWHRHGGNLASAVWR